MPYIDPAASARLRELRSELGYSAERLAQEITELATEQQWKVARSIDAFTIRRLEGNERWHGRVPRLRSKVLIESFFGEQIWKDSNRFWVEDARKQAMVAA